MTFDTELTNDPVCPHCGTADQDWWDGLDGRKQDGDRWECVCGHCNKKYRVTMCVTTTFSTEAAA